MSTTEHTDLREFSVVYTDRALNHMSGRFQDVLRDVASTLRDVYQADATIVVPGSGSFGMEAVARQFGTGSDCLVLRNGWFSFRWSQIFEAGGIPASEHVLKARPVSEGPHAPFAPTPVDEVIDAIRELQPDVVFAAHVETASGMLLPDEYLRAVGHAARASGALFVLDSIASGALWVDMPDVAVDVLISAPQKGWSGPACCALVMLGPRALERLDQTRSTSFVCDLRKWHEVMTAYEAGGHAYHATLPTDALRAFHAAMRETVDGLGLETARARQIELGHKVRATLERRGFPSVAAEGYQAPGVVVSYTSDPEVRSGRAFGRRGLQIAAGVPLRCDEPDDFSTFRLGLFGLDKLSDVDGTVAVLDGALDGIRAGAQA